MTGRYVLRHKETKMYYRSHRRTNWDNWVADISLATVFYTTANIGQHRCMKDCDIVYVKFEEVL